MGKPATVNLNIAKIDLEIQRVEDEVLRAEAAVEAAEESFSKCAAQHEELQEKLLALSWLRSNIDKLRVD